MPFVKETKNVEFRDFVSDLTGLPVTLTDTDPDPEPYKHPPVKDFATLYMTTEQAEALTTFLTTGDGSDLRELLAAKPASNGSGTATDNGKFAGVVREWASTANVDAGKSGRVKGEVYASYFRANPDATVPEGADKGAVKAYATVHPAHPEPAASE